MLRIINLLNFLGRFIADGFFRNLDGLSIGTILMPQQYLHIHTNMIYVSISNKI
uniref:Uncharacterized protein n=1 Tax=viral metagenome TaxID=1070528 RepID=A0A6C0KJK4_9ZZZZ